MSLRIDGGILDHLRPFDELYRDEITELFGRARKCLEACIGEPALHIRTVDDAAEFGIEGARRFPVASWPARPVQPMNPVRTRSGLTRARTAHREGARCVAAA